MITGILAITLFFGSGDMARNTMSDVHKKYFMGLSDTELMARTIWAEARGQGYAGQVAVANVILNRVNDSLKRFGKGVKGVLLKRWAFSCFEPADPNFSGLMKDINILVMVEARLIAQMAIEGLLLDPTDGATHYFNPSIAKPSWMSKLEYKAQIEDHVFYREA